MKQYKEQKEHAKKFITLLRNEEFEEAFSFLGTLEKEENYFWTELWNYSRPKDAVFFAKFLEIYRDKEKDEIYWKLLESVQFTCEKEYEKALSLLLEIEKLEPDNVTLYDSLGRVYYCNEDRDNSKKSWEKALELMPNDAFAWNGFGILASVEEAITFFKQAIELEPEYVYPYGNISKVFLVKKEYKQAIEFCYKAIEIDSNYEGSYFTLGLIYEVIKEYDKAIEFSEKAIELNFDEHKSLYRLIAVSYLNLKNYRQAKNHFDKYLEYFPDDVKAFSKLQEVYKFLNKSKNGKLSDIDSSSNTYKNTFLFINSEKSKDFFQNNLKKFLTELSINTTDKIEDADSAVFIQPYDFIKNKDEVQELIQSIQGKAIPFQIYVMDEDFPLPVKYQSSKESDEIDKIYNTLKTYPEKNLNFFPSMESLQNDLQLFLASKSVLVKLVNLELENIGLFARETFHFDREISVIIGTNGTGKTTILRSLALGLIGNKHKTTPNESLRTLWNIRQWKLEGNEKGIIKIQYEINSKHYENSIEFSRDEKSGEIFIHSKNTDTLFNGSFLKLPIIGFGQQRKLLSSAEKKKDFLDVIPASINDITNLITNKEDERLHSFVSWIANLKNESQKEGRQKKESLIHLAFEILSKITGEDFQFKELKNVDPLEVWITTSESPDGIPIEYASQGCQTIMGWVGYIIERMYESYPYSDNFTQEPAIVLIDEIDSFLHPKWQKKVLKVLKETFPNAQIIASTHSPLVVDGLEKNQVMQLSYEEKNKTINVTRNPVDIWAWDYEEILLKLFDVYQEPELYESLIVEKMEAIQSKGKCTESEKEELERLQELLDRIEESRIYKDEIEQKRKELREKEEFLNRLIEKYNNGKK
ncbi:MAG: AAA family ATPase [Leptospiraceae bacterium]|nr:AAA family ATPase [Leptospiraceae bacterium]